MNEIKLQSQDILKTFLKKVNLNNIQLEKEKILTIKKISVYLQT